MLWKAAGLILSIVFPPQTKHTQKHTPDRKLTKPGTNETLQSLSKVRHILITFGPQTLIQYTVITHTHTHKRLRWPFLRWCQFPEKMRRTQTRPRDRKCSATTSVIGFSQTQSHTRKQTSTPSVHPTCTGGGYEGLVYSDTVQTDSSLSRTHIQRG